MRIKGSGHYVFIFDPVRYESPPERFKLSSIVLFYDSGYLEGRRNVVAQRERELTTYIEVSLQGVC